ncbi:HlyD family type I secretion periplasmic adaptor subunit [Pseudodesulfovibrio sediminis]|uniref:HlyD family type I secretion periplasmic adaptor subunit n=1 Tax=Pseudodesulfovibrio sediminis TaxID=2810563 RepID=A0ABM7P5D2_9BACT|nr:HlyD family type I secretion periplasmic adaptor subunit [Pseudodesulfovibrio sediminis]BCS88127.1 HlyD family type I secretion periplasmic adaptor subunit [Pseudodesulfovibrio sediminis]
MSPTNKIRIDRRKSMHLSQALLLEETGVPRLIRYVILTLTLVIAAFITWASITQIDEVAMTSGKIIPSGHVKKVQSEDGGVILDILVREGEAVKRGQDLIIMDPTISVSNLDQHLVRNASLILRKERLQALIDGRKPDYSNVDPKYAELAGQQTRLHGQKMQSMEVTRAILNNQINQYEAELKELKNREKTLRQQYQLMKEEYETYESLFKRELIGKTEFFGIKRQFLQVQEYLNQIPVRRIQVREKLTESKNRLVKLKEDALENWMAELATIEAESSEVLEVVKRYEMDVFQLSIKAPEDGVVHNLQINSSGEVIKPGETVLELVPMGESLVAEVQISSRDVGHIQEGQSVTVKLTAYDYARYGGMKGTLTDISPTTIIDAKGRVYYKGIVTLESKHLESGTTKHLILPGMTVQADIKTGEKTLIGYFMKPIYLSLVQSFRER